MTWIAFPGGVVSIVEKPTDRGKDTLTVRARDKKSLAAFCTLATGHDVKPKNIKFKMATDYPYRRVLKREQVDTAVLEIARGITYSNFKDEAKRVRGAAYAGVLGRVWTALLSLEDNDTRKAISKEQSRWTTPLASLAGPGTEDDWTAILGDAVAPSLTEAEYDELAELEDIIEVGGVHALTDAQYARYEALS